MTLLDLPEAQNKDQATLFAKAYADNIKACPQLRRLKCALIKAQKEQAPEWFLRMLYVDTDNILFRIDQLHHWGRDYDPRGFALNTSQRIRIAVDMVSNFLNPSRMYFGGIKRTETWLAEGESESMKPEPQSMRIL
ncbi:hypothetical protein [Proteus terrae]|uniref:hypothetical protein n=1 Tax=Proteus terrae TaxID=1574161 RepID=UPI000D68B1D3|nr:hypothetical protein [Proteus terrae]